MVTRARTTLALLAFILLSSQLAAAGRLVLVSWDGANHDVVLSMIQAGKLPNLAGMASNGCWQNGWISEHATVTLPGHAEMLTGMPPDSLGIVDNQPKSIPPGFSIWERLPPAYWNGYYSTVPMLSVLFLNARRSIDAWGPPESGQLSAGELALSANPSLSRPGDLFVLAHFDGPDEAGHGWGVSSPQYEQALAEADSALGMLRAEAGPGTDFLVTTDHGFGPGKGHDSGLPVDREIWIVASRPICGSNTAFQSDIAPTVYSELVINYSAWNLPGKPIWERNRAGAPDWALWVTLAIIVAAVALAPWAFIMLKRSK